MTQVHHDIHNGVTQALTGFKLSKHVREHRPLRRDARNMAKVLRSIDEHNAPIIEAVQSKTDARFAAYRDEFAWKEKP